MMVEEFEFYRKVRANYCNVSFMMWFTYRLSHRHSKTATARGAFSCGVNAHTQTLEYTIQLKSEPIGRPYSESGTFLFPSVYEEIPQQVIEYENYPIHKQRYRVPITYDWHEFVRSGARSGINVHTMQALLGKWKLRGKGEDFVDAKLKVTKLQFDW
ncbi:hypothetical protein RB620_23215 [Paenibacillus sp. LHD-117]|uniref:hypothetical protein n=1 Tax=Paenibacillus sp. LHD-117 TaxID=3071412 RepID=UPI0027E15125|nr:hypothetical protein [Paenibacillus sp. LHD-117]MDQ6422344.1 hypothetical protein [Paenibacillus sp. LHD-117]